MKYVRIFEDEHRRSAFEDLEVEGALRHVADGIPPLLVAGPFSVNGLILVEQPVDEPEWAAHPAPRKQWLIVLQGRVAVTVSTGERREFDPGQLLFVEDTEGEGHTSIPVTPDFKFAMIPVEEKSTPG